MLSDEQMSNGWPFSLLNDEQMSNWLGVEHQPDNIYSPLTSVKKTLTLTERCCSTSRCDRCDRCSTRWPWVCPGPEGNGTQGWIYGYLEAEPRISGTSSSGWWQLKDFWNFHPCLWGHDPIWRAYFSNGLVQPPTRVVWEEFFFNGGKKQSKFSSPED